MGLSICLVLACLVFAYFCRCNHNGAKQCDVEAAGLGFQNRQHAMQFATSGGIKCPVLGGEELALLQTGVDPEEIYITPLQIRDNQRKDVIEYAKWMRFRRNLFAFLSLAAMLTAVVVVLNR